MRVPRRAALPALLIVLAGCAHSGSGSDATSTTTTNVTTTNAGAGDDAGAAADADAGAAADGGLAGPDAGANEGGAAWAKRLAPILFRDVNTLADVSMRLYKDDGSLDDAAAAEVERVLWAAKDEAPPHVSRRLLQLVVRVAEHFGAHEIEVISSHRGKARKGSRHRSGEAIDFVLPNVPAKKVAEELRTYPRVGVGVYIHPRSQFVHLDVREQSYHWVDGSPPKRSWREVPMPDPTAAARDAAYDPKQDLPESATKPM
ncbi:MAG: DUF882 domain-containing protein [Polyangiaceae bacterium]